MNNETQTTGTQTDILSESDVGFEYATRWQRFFNFLIDYIVMSWGLSFLTATPIILIFQYTSPETLEDIGVFGTSAYYLFNYVLGFLNFLLYYTLAEKLFQGRTLGKLITGTKAVRMDGSALTFKDAILRSLSRLVPFEFLSGFGIPWHDSWTDTTVVKTR